jgi:flagellar motor switch protein FliM
MAAAGAMADGRNGLIERLVGETAEPARVAAAARAIGERALPVIAKSLTELLASPFQVELDAVELGRIGEVFQVDNDAEPMTVAASANSPDALLLSMDEPAISLFTGLFFGGGADAAPAAIGRPLSAVERQVAARTFRCLAEALNGSGQRALNLRFPLPAPIFGEDRRRQVHRDGPSARLVFKFWNAGGIGRVCVTMPQRIVLSKRGDDAKAGPAAEWQARFGGEVMRSKVVLDATMSLGRLTLGEISALRPGQVLEFTAEAPGEARLSAKDNALFVCEFGKLGQHYTVRIKHPFDPEQELIDGLMSA